MDPIYASISYYVRSLDDIPGLVRLKDYPIHLSLKHGYENLMYDVGKAIVDDGIHISSIHGPKFQPEKGSRPFKDLNRLIGAKTFTIHSDRRPLENVCDSWMPVLRDLASEGITVAFENSRKTGDWLEDPYLIPDNPLFNLTLDFNHIPRQYPDELQVLRDLAAKVKVVHVVDRHSTSPYSRWSELIPLAAQYLPHTEFVMEYGRNNMEYMLADYKAIQVENKRVAQEKFKQISNLETGGAPNSDAPKSD